MLSGLRLGSGVGWPVQACAHVCSDVVVYIVVCSRPAFLWPLALLLVLLLLLLLLLCVCPRLQVLHPVEYAKVVSRIGNEMDLTQVGQQGFRGMGFRA